MCGSSWETHTYIYLLHLDNGKKYIGKTQYLNIRMYQHFSGNGAMVTRKFKPKTYEVLDICPGYLSTKLEQKYTIKFIADYGYDNVRGGSYINSKTLN